MKAIVLQTPGEFRLADLPEPQSPTLGHALVRAHRVGICGTDLHAYEGVQPFFTYPRILGHELGVEILEIGDNDYGLRSGDRCAVEPYLNCGECIACRNGKTNCCESLQVLGVHVDGGMRERFTVPASKLHSSSTLRYDQLALVETLGIGCHAVQRAALEPNDVALILGAGPIGLTTVEFARIAGAHIVVADINEKRLAFSRETMGVEHVIHPDRNIPEYCLRQFGHLPTAVFDCTGNPQSMNTSFEYVANGGRIVFVGFYMGEVTFNDQEFHRREITLMASRNARGEDMRRIIQLMEAGRIDASRWITHRAPIDEMIRAFPAWLRPENGVVKAMVEWR